MFYSIYSPSLVKILIFRKKYFQNLIQFLLDTLEILVQIQRSNKDSIADLEYDDVFVKGNVAFRLRLIFLEFNDLESGNFKLSKPWSDETYMLRSNNIQVNCDEIVFEKVTE